MPVQQLSTLFPYTTLFRSPWLPAWPVPEDGISFLRVRSQATERRRQHRRDRGDREPEALHAVGDHLVGLSFQLGRCRRPEVLISSKLPKLKSPGIVRGFFWRLLSRLAFE